MSANFEQMSLLLQKGKMKDLKVEVQAALDSGANALDILEKGLMSGMGIIGERFKNNDIFIPEVLIAARAMNAATELLKPFLAASGVEAKGVVVLGTVKDDLHDIGKNLVRMMMESKGLTVIDLGTNCAPEAYIKAAQENNANIIACSALLTTTMSVMQTVVEQAIAAGIRDQVKIMIGGAPVTQAFCDKIGADSYTPDASTAAEKALEFCNAE